MAAPFSPLATINCEPRQARKGAAAAVASGAGVWRIGVAALLKVKGETRRVKGQEATAFPRHWGLV